MVEMDNYEKDGGENSYEYKMKAILESLKITPSVQRDRNWDPTENVLRNRRKIGKVLVIKQEISERKKDNVKLIHCPALRVKGLPKTHKEKIPFRAYVMIIG